MSLLQDASLLVTPNAYKEGKLYSVIPSNGNGDFTATRATTATRVNSAGLVDLVPYNLLQYSEDFSNAVYTKIGTTVTSNTTTAPDGTLTADTMTAVDGNSRVLYGLSLGAGTYKFSLYVKILTQTTAGTLRLGYIADGVTTFVSFTPTTEWGRFDATITATSSVTQLQIRNNTFVGSVAIWGAQLVEGTSARDYLRTETRLNIPRVDYSLGGCPNILLEPQRTNLALQSSSFDNASWVKGFVSITANTTTSPSGISDADTFTGDGTSAIHNMAQSISVISGTTYTISVYAKKNTNNFLQITPLGSATFGVNAWGNFNLDTGVVGSVGSSATASIQSVGNGWYRCSITAAAISTASSNIALILISSATSARLESNTLSTSVFLWGAQFEAGAYSTSFIPTTTASVTRNADTLTRNNIFTNGLITAAGGTWFLEFRNNRSLVRDGFADGLWLRTALGQDGFKIRNTLSVSVFLVVEKLVSNVTTNLYTIPTSTAKVAIKWNGSTADIFVNGVKVVSATAFTATNMEILNGNGADVPKYINEMALFPTPLTDAQMSMLTSDIYPTAAAAYASLGLVSESPSCLTSTTTF